MDYVATLLMLAPSPALFKAAREYSLLDVG
jgi:hypothetical protein